ncbi:sensor histidine kinase [Parafrigoribacterium soli]|uniref:sensor histidine kinase n=1 Tax=Parafrigoribacterium soli TaxID=3144663 RepID=UPI0032EF8FB5
MNERQANSTTVDGDTLAVRRASRRVGIQIAVASTVVVVAIITGIYLFVITKVKPGEVFELVPDPENLDVSAGDVLRGAVVLGIVLIVCAGILGWFITRQAVRPLGNALRMQRTFVADASHELRTPLTVLDARLQVLQRGLAADDPSAATVAQLRDDAKSLVDVVNDLLLAAEPTAGPSAETAATPVRPVIDAVATSMQLIADEKAVRITAADIEPVSAVIPETSLHRCLVALLDNAVRFAPEGSEVAIGVSATRSLVEITVSDRGPGIRDISPRRIFDRFAHGRSAGEQTTATRSGFGIGLALVRDIATRHGGSVTVVRSSAEGTEIGLSVPRAR